MDALTIGNAHVALREEHPYTNENLCSGKPDTVEGTLAKQLLPSKSAMQRADYLVRGWSPEQIHE
ncbi:hypothetical protein [Mesorhizobium sp. ORM16]|uniref:hypothetical protein n=1 Tax=Mesorhizobium sp. ORM16 TaxID=3376989 RepID=UPI0038575E28